MTTGGGTPPQVDRDSLFSCNFEVLRQAMGVTRSEIAAALAQQP